MKPENNAGEGWVISSFKNNSFGGEPLYLVLHCQNFVNYKKTIHSTNRIIQMDIFLNSFMKSVL